MIEVVIRKDGPYDGNDGYWYFSYEGISYGPFEFWEDAKEAYESHVNDCLRSRYGDDP